MNIYEKMSAISQEISTVAKNLEVGFGQSKYKAVGEADVLAAVKPIEAKYKVYSYPISRDIVDSGELMNIDRNGNEKRQLYLRIKTIYRFVDTDDPKQFIDIETYGDGVDPQDKAPGKAMTYGDKYALLKAYKIQTGDDPDQNASEPLKIVTHRATDDMKKMLCSLIKEHDLKPSELVSLQGLKGWSGLTVEMFKAAMKELGEE